jgi:MFS family permease
MPGRIFSSDFLYLLTGGFSFYTSMWLMMTYIPSYVLNLGGSEADIGLVLSAFAFMALLSRPFVGRMVDVLGRKSVALAGCLVFALAPLLYTVAASAPQLVLIRMFHGLGISFFGTAGTTWVADIVPANRRAEAMGIYSNASQIAIAIAPLLGAAIVASAGVRPMFVVSSFVGFVGLALVFLARTQHKADRLPSGGGGFRVALGRRDVLSMTFALMTAAATWGVLMSFLPIYTAQRQAGQAPLFFTVYAVCSVVLRLVIGPMSDRLGRRVVVAPAIGLMAITMLAFVALSSPLMLYVLAAAYAVSFGIIYPTLSAFLVDVVPANVRGSAIGVFTAGFDLGIMIGSYLGGLVAEAMGLGTTFAAIGVLCLVGLVVFWVGTKEAAAA